MLSDKRLAVTSGPATDDALDESQATASVDLETILQFQPVARERQPRWDGVFVAQLVGVNPRGQALLNMPEMPILPPAASTVAVGAADIGRQAAVMFQQGDVRNPLVIGWIRNACPPPAPLPVEARVDEDRLELTANREIVLRCGRASITLTRAGKVLIRGAYVSSRSSGANCITGGSVQIN